MEALLAKVPLLLLVSSRIAGIVTASPVFNNRLIPTPMRVALTFLLGFLLLPAARAVPEALTGTGLMPSAVLELIIGLTIGFLGQLVFAAVQMAGALMDMDMGLTMAQIMDPVSGRSDPILSAFFQTLALVIYLSLNAHHWLLRAIAGSYDTVLAGGFSTASAGPMHVVLMFGSMLAAAVKMVLPFMGVLLLTSTALAGINRAMPHMNVFAVGMGSKALVGLIMVTLILPYFPGFLESLFSIGHAELLRTLQLFR